MNFKNTNTLFNTYELFRNKVRLGRAHLYHMVTSSPWPYVVSWCIFLFLVGNVCYFQNYVSTGIIKFWIVSSLISAKSSIFSVSMIGTLFFLDTFILPIVLVGFFLLIISAQQWIRDIIREGTFQGNHSYIVQRSFRLGVFLFILSEVLFFFSFFWTFFHSSLSPTTFIGCVWPPKGLFVLDPWGVPFANTLILLYSGISITLAHHALVIGTDIQAINRGFIFTLIAAYVFILLQFVEYTYAPFSISDGIYGAIFFLTTGFHGAHVIIGSFLILFCYERHCLAHFLKDHIIGFEAAAWYWHFVDVVWLFVFTFYYWWGGDIN